MPLAGLLRTSFVPCNFNVLFSCMLETGHALCCARDFLHAKPSLFVLAGTIVSTNTCSTSNLALQYLWFRLATGDTGNSAPFALFRSIARRFCCGCCGPFAIDFVVRINIRIPQKLFDDRPAMTGKSIYFASDQRIFTTFCTVSFFQEGVVSALCNFQLVSVQRGDVAIVRKVILVDSSRCQANAGVSSLLARLQAVGRSFVGRLLPGENGQAERVILALDLALGFRQIQTLHAIRTIVSEVEKSVAFWPTRDIRHTLLTQAGERVAKPASNFRLCPR